MAGDEEQTSWNLADFLQLLLGLIAHGATEQ